MERLADDTIESFMNAIEERLAEGQKNKIPFSRFLEEKMDAFDYSNTSLAKKVFHRVEKKKEGTISLFVFFLIISFKVILLPDSYI